MLSDSECCQDTTYNLFCTLSILNLNSISLRGDVGGPNIGVKTTKRAVTFHNNESDKLAQIILLFSFLNMFKLS